MGNLQCKQQLDVNFMVFIPSKRANELYNVNIPNGTCLELSSVMPIDESILPDVLDEYSLNRLISISKGKDIYIEGHPFSPEEALHIGYTYDATDPPIDIRVV